RAGELWHAPTTAFAGRNTMPRMRPIGERRPEMQRGRPISLGGSEAIGSVWDAARLADGTLIEEVRDGSRWQLAVVIDGIEIGRLAHVGSGSPQWRGAGEGPSGDGRAPETPADEPGGRGAPHREPPRATR